MNLATIWPALAAMAALVMVLITIAGLFGNSIKNAISREATARGESAERILNGQSSLKSDLKVVTDKHEHRIEKLEEKSADFRPSKAIADDILHARNNVVTIIDGVIHQHNKTAQIVDGLRDRVTRLETQHEQTASMVGEIKNELRDTRSEINHRFDTMADSQKAQFDQLCQSIREVTKREIK